MFAKIWASSLLVLALCLQVTAHAAVSPALGIQGNPTRGDVQRPTSAKPCGNVDITSKIGSSTLVPADASGSFIVNGICFNGGHDGSLKFTAKVDPTGTGEDSKFVDMDITTNGNDSPPKAETVPITAQLPSGMKCKNNKCLVQFISGSGFGNCVVVQQNDAASTGNSTGNTAAGNLASFNSTAGGDSSANSTVAAAGNLASFNSTTGGDSSANSTAAGCQANTASTRRSAGAGQVYARGGGSGSLMARLLLADLRNRGEGAVEIAKRDT